jgi:hypothetical protein
MAKQPKQPTIAERKEAEKTFHTLFKDGAETPESIMVKVMHGQTTIMHNGKRKRITKEMQNAASMLLPYRLPRLNAIDAVQRNVDMTHEEWLESLDDGAADDE